MNLTQWAERVKVGRRRVTFVGMMGDATPIHGRISRVTTCAVWVKLDGGNLEPMHPEDIIPA